MVKMFACLAVLTLGVAGSLGVPEPRLKYFLNVKGDVQALTPGNVILMVSHAGAIPVGLAVTCMVFRFRVVDVSTEEDVTSYDPALGCASGERTVTLNPGDALKFTDVYPDITGLPPGRYRLEVSLWEKPAAPVAVTEFGKR